VDEWKSPCLGLEADLVAHAAFTDALTALRRHALAHGDGADAPGLRAHDAGARAARQGL
jgi:hypothetical protein